MTVEAKDTDKKEQLFFRGLTGVQVRAAEDTKEQTVEFAFASGTPVKRYDWYSGETYFEVLECTPEAMDITRLEDGGIINEGKSVADFREFVLENIEKTPSVNALQPSSQTVQRTQKSARSSASFVQLSA